MSVNDLQLHRASRGPCLEVHPRTGPWWWGHRPTGFCFHVSNFIHLARSRYSFKFCLIWLYWYILFGKMVFACTPSVIFCLCQVNFCFRPFCGLVRPSPRLLAVLSFYPCSAMATAHHCVTFLLGRSRILICLSTPPPPPPSFHIKSTRGGIFCLSGAVVLNYLILRSGQH